MEIIEIDNLKKEVYKLREECKEVSVKLDKLQILFVEIYKVLFNKLPI